MQSFKRSIIEKLTDQILGIIIAFITTRILFALGILTSPLIVSDNISSLVITALYAVISSFRGLFVRRVFNRSDKCPVCESKNNTK